MADQKDLTGQGAPSPWAWEPAADDQAKPAVESTKGPEPSAELPSDESQAPSDAPLGATLGDDQPDVEQTALLRPTAAGQGWRAGASVIPAESTPAVGEPAAEPQRSAEWAGPVVAAPVPSATVSASAADETPLTDAPKHAVVGASAETGADASLDDSAAPADGPDGDDSESPAEVTMSRAWIEPVPASPAASGQLAETAPATSETAAVTAAPAVDPTSSPLSPGIFRDDEPARVEAVSDEERKLAAERAARREARIKALTATATPAPVVAAPAPVVVTQRSTDKFFPSFGLLLLRIVLAAVFGIRGFDLLANRDAVNTALQSTVLPQPEIWTWVAGIGSLAVALCLLLGLLTRVAGAGALLIAAGSLCFVMWGASWNPFATPPTSFLTGQYAFLGEFELLAAVVGFMFLCVGGGGISIDRAYRSSRQHEKTAAFDGDDL